MCVEADVRGVSRDVSYVMCVRELQKDKLEELDAWFQTTLPDVLHGRDPKAFITQKELVKLMEWKLKKGKWCVIDMLRVVMGRISSFVLCSLLRLWTYGRRPALMKYIESLSEAAVQKASAKALRELAGEKLKSAIEALAELKGVRTTVVMYYTYGVLY